MSVTYIAAPTGVPPAADTDCRLLQPVTPETVYGPTLAERRSKPRNLILCLARAGFEPTTSSTAGKRLTTVPTRQADKSDLYKACSTKFDLYKACSAQSDPYKACSAMSDLYEARVFLVYFLQLLIGLQSNCDISIGAHRHQIGNTLKPSNQAIKQKSCIKLAVH